jgi:peptide/nickel transport system substrate-binding protein
LFHCGRPPFDDVRARQAVMYAIDRDSITQTSFFGQAEPVWGSEIPAEDPDHAATRTTYRFDPDHARRLLAAAGHDGSPVPVDLLVGSNLEYLASQAPVIEENLRAVGFAPNIVPGELESLYSRVAEGSYHLFLMKGDTSALGVTDAEFALRWIFYGNLARQFMFWNGDPLVRVEALLDQALVAPDETTRRAVLAEVQELVQEEVPIGRLHRANQLTGWSEKLVGFRPAPVPGFVLDGVSG